MGIFKFRKRKDVIDLTKYRKGQENLNLKKESSQSQDLDFLGNLASASSDSLNVSEPDERKRKLAKRLTEITNRTEELSNQLYHLQQRIELLERKVGLKSFE